MKYAVYIMRCADGTLYTGITTDLRRREAAHNGGRGAKYTRARLPVKAVYVEYAENRSEASKRESSIKKLTRAQKTALIEECGLGTIEV